MFANPHNSLFTFVRRCLTRTTTEQTPETQRQMDALLRAARRAHFIAHQTGTKVILAGDDGKVIEIEPDPNMYEELENFKD